MNTSVIIVIIVVAGILTERGIEAWQKVQLAKHGYREGRDGNVNKL